MLTALSVLPLTWIALTAAQHVPNATIIDTNTALQLKVASSGGNATSPLQYGIMFEDINHSGDGGVYAEMIQNRAFQGSEVFPPNLTNWGSIGGAALELVADALSDALPNSMKVTTSGSDSTSTSSGWGPWSSSQPAPAPANGSIGFYNTGYWGFSVKPQTYTGSFYVKGDYSGDFVASFASNTTGEVLTSVSITSESVANAWTQHNFTLTPTSAAPDSNNTFSITFDASASGLEFSLISVFPPTYKNRANGLRPDLMTAMADLNPSFLRFAGGNNLEGNEAPYYWKWNETIGPLIDRPGRPGTWGYENTDGLGLIDYLNWCTDLELEPILAVWSGLYLDGTIIPQAELQPYIDEALALLEFIMGSPDTTNGALRVSLGYGTEPLAQINYVEVGNEDNLNNGSDSYREYRYPMFYEAISSAYPDMNIIASTVNITLPANDPHSMGDYHVYGRPNDLVLEFADFDQNTSAHKIFLGEYASIQENFAGDELAPVNWTAEKFLYPRWIGTVAEAIYLIGAERNSDAILGAGYAPTFQNVNSYQWAPDMISYSADPDQTTLSTSYYMIQLLSQNRLTETLPVTAAEGGFGPAYFVAGKAQDGRQMMKFAVYNSSVPVDFNVMFEGAGGSGSGQLTLLTGPEDANEANVFGTGENVVTRTVSEVQVGSDGSYSFQVPELSVGIFAV